MKIYASRRDPNKLESYVGKHIWIKVQIINDDIAEFCKPSYLIRPRLINADGSVIGYIICLDMPSRKVHSIRNHTVDDFKIVQPIQVYTDEEVTEIRQGKIDV